MPRFILVAPLTAQAALISCVAIAACGGMPDGRGGGMLAGASAATGATGAMTAGRPAMSAAGRGAAGHSSGGAGAGPGADGGVGGKPAVKDGGAAAGDGGAAMADAGSDDAGSSARDPDGVWSALTIMAIVDPRDHGAIGDGTTDDLAALSATVSALPAAGGIVYLAQGASFKKTDLLIVTQDHVKFWAPNRQAELFQSINGQRRHQSIVCRNNTGCGFFGLKLRSDASARFDALEDNQISIDHGSLVEITGCEVDGSAAAGIFLYGSTEHYIQGNYIHHTWADHIHHTDAARQSWVFRNYIFNEAPSKGDDGVACVTYGTTSPLCGDMEWWNNTILHTGWGRGYSVIGGDNISIHDNWAIGVAGAGIIVASESSYNSASSDSITIERNKVYQCSQSIGHPGILISGENSAAAPLSNIALLDNVSADNVMGNAYRAEGAYTNLTNVGLKTTAADLTAPVPSSADVQMADTTILRTRDVSHVDQAFRLGLHRVQVRRAPDGVHFQQRFEYVVKGPVAEVTRFSTARVTDGDYLSEQRTVGDSAYALLLCSAPIAVPTPLAAVSFRELRAGDKSGDLSWLWQRIELGAE